MDSPENSFIKKHFKITECFKFAESKGDNCVCGKVRDSHEITDSEESWSFENNTRSKVCDEHGFIKFTGYNKKSDDDHPKFIRFDGKSNDSVESNVYNLLIQFWKFPQPKLLISVSGGFKRMHFKTQLQKKHFQQGLIDVMNKENSWLIGGGFKVGIHQLLSETVNEYRIFHHGHQNRINLIGICTWGVVQNKEKISAGEFYENTNVDQQKSVLLDALYDCYLFCDDGTEKQYDKEIDFRLKFENYITNIENVLSVQILFEGGQRALGNVYMSLKQGVPLVVISGSGRAADIISKVMALTEKDYNENIDTILKEYKDFQNITENKEYLVDMFKNHKDKIIIHDILQENIKLDRKIVEAVYSKIKIKSTKLKHQDSDNLNTAQNEENKKKEKILELMVTFNCYDLAEIDVFQSKMLTSFVPDKLLKMLLNVIEKNRPKFVSLFLDNYFDGQIAFNYTVIVELYRKSLHTSNCHCRNLLRDLLRDKNKNERENISAEKLLNSITKIIHLFSGNILKNENNFEDLDINPRDMKAKFNKSAQRMNLKYKRIDSLKTTKIEVKDLFLWALLSGYIEMAEVFWKRLQSPVGSALIASIILKKMQILLLKRGDSDMSNKLGEASKKFQSMGVSIISESYGNDQLKTFQILNRKLDEWSKLSCLQIAISGELLDFLQQSACQFYTNESWMGKLSTFLPNWKIWFGILFIPFCFKPSWIKSYFQKTKHLTDSKNRNSRLTGYNNEINKDVYNIENANDINSLTYFKAIKIFYNAPKVKFVVYLGTYIVFLLIFAYLNLVEMKPLDRNSKIQNSPAEIYVYIYVLGLLIEEIRQINNQERTGTIHNLSAYLSGSWNIYDIFIISLFIVSAIFRFSISKNNFIITRCLFSVTFSLFCLRTMQFYFISRILGPKIIMIRRMISDILFFLSIFTLFIISYGTLIQSLQQEHNEMTLSLIKDVFYRPYFQTYGELMLDGFDVPSPCNTTTCIAKYTTMICGFAIFLLLTTILLVNLLIAMFGHTFNQIQVESEKYFVFIRIQLVEEFYKKSVIMPPLNIVCYIALGAIKFCNYVRDINIDRPDSFLVRNLNTDICEKISLYEKICLKYALLKTQEEKDPTNYD